MATCNSLQRIAYDYVSSNDEDSEGVFITGEITYKNPRRSLRDMTNVLEMPTKEFVTTFRVSKEIFVMLLDVLQGKWTPAIRSTFIRPDIKLATFLRFIATGSFLEKLGKEAVSSTGKSSACRIIRECLPLFDDWICDQWIQEPSAEDESIIMDAFFDSCGFPGVLGCVDGTHIRIKSPGDELKSLYCYSEKGFTSINVMIICDHEMRILFVDASHPGSNSDSFVWGECEPNRRMQHNFDCGGKNACWILDGANFVSYPSTSEYYSDMDAAYHSPNNSQQNWPYPQTQFDTTVLFNQTLSYGGETAFHNFGQNQMLPTPPLPSTQDIMQIYGIQDVLKVPKLENKHRTKIAKALILFILNSAPTRGLMRDDFLQLAQSIVEIFPSEVQETYYVPFTKGHFARGKLYDAYNNARARLRAAGVIRKPVRAKSEEKHSASKTFSSLATSEPDCDLDASCSIANSSLPIFSHIKTELPVENPAPVLRTMSCDSEAELLSNAYIQPDYLRQLPSTHDIRNIWEFQEVLKVRMLENKHRTRIAKTIISFILKRTPDRRLIRDDFLQLTQSIVEIFPTEIKETYYVPSKDGRLARGKLFDAYNNARSRLSAAGLIRRRVNTKSAENQMKNSTIGDIKGVDPADESELEILKSDCSVGPSVLMAWSKSFIFRQNELHNQNMTTIDYMEKYKVLLNERNYELIDLDFKMLYPTSKGIYKWKMYYHKIIVKAEKLKDGYVKEILAYIQNTEDEDTKLALSLILVPYLLPNHRQRTKLEIQEAFICYCKNLPAADDGSETDAKRLKTENEPKIVLIGDGNKIIDHAFVDIFGKRLKFENPLKAIETCFQSFLTMNIGYPSSCAHVWLFIQKLIFEITTPSDIVIPSITTLINDLHSDVPI